MKQIDHMKKSNSFVSDFTLQQIRALNTLRPSRLITVGFKDDTFLINISGVTYARYHSELSLSRFLGSLIAKL